MNQNVENRIKNYIKNHKNYKKWIAFALCISLLTGTVTLYMLNKPATAMTEEGAETVGVVIPTADSSFEQQLIEDMQENADNTENTDGENTDVENSDGDNTEDQSNVENKESGEDLSGESVNTTEASSHSTSGSLDNSSSSEASSGLSVTMNSSSSASASASASSSIEASGMASSAASSSSSSASTSASSLAASSAASIEVPESVDLSQYVTETIIERLNEDGEWEVISEDEIRPADTLRITFNYVIPKEATLSEDIHLDIPDEFGTITETESSVTNGDGNLEVTEDNKLKIQYDEKTKEEIKKEIINEKEEDSDLHASLSFPYALTSFFNMFTLTVYAEEGDVSGSVTVTSSTKGMVVESVSVAKNPTETTNSDGTKSYSGGTAIENGSLVSEGETLLFKLGYKLGIGTISEGDTSIEYDFSESGITPKANVSGLVYENNKEIGTFTVDTDCKVVIDFYTDFASKNSTQVVYGDFYFTANAECNPDEESTTKEYKFAEDVSFTVTIKKNNYYDLSAEKKASTYTKGDKTIKYTVTLSTNKGTGDEINVSDYMEVYQFNGTAYGYSSINESLSKLIDLTSQISDMSVKKTDAKGVTTSVEASDYSASGKTFSLKLPKLEAGEKYVIEYTYNLPDGIINTYSSSIKINNKIDASSTSTGTKSASVDTIIEGDRYPEIKKTGSADTSNKKVTWTITINSNNQNLNGYTLVDNIYRFGTSTQTQQKNPYSGEMTVKSVTLRNDGENHSLNEGDTITLDGANGYTFNSDDYSTYVLEYSYNYTTTDILYHELKNGVSLKKNDKGYSDTAKVSVGWPSAISKTATGMSLNNDGTYKLDWTVTLKAPITRNEGEGNSEYWVFYETIRDENEVFTESDIANIENALKEVYTGQYEITKYDSKTLGKVTGYKKFSIKVYEDVASDINISFSSTGYVGDGQSSITFTNRAGVYNVDAYYNEASLQYDPIVQKFDGNNNSGDTSYDYYEQSLFKEGILTWNIKVQIPSKHDYETLTIVDTLPDGVTLLKNGTYNGTELYGLGMASNNSYTDYWGFDDPPVEASEYGASYKVDGNKVIITFNAKAAAGKTFYLKLRAKINDEFDFTNADIAPEGKATFTNNVQVQTSDGLVIGSDSQTQHITKTETAMYKTSKTVSGSINTIEYELDVNPNAIDLLENGDTLTLTDTLVSTIYGAKLTTALVPGSVQVLEVATDGTETALLTSDYSYAISEHSAEKDNSQNYYNYNTIEFTIPDGKHLKVKYQYTFTGLEGWEATLTNNATLQGISLENNSAKNVTKFKILNAGATASVRGINLFKVDNENQGIFLSGAEFKLYKWNNKDSKNPWVEVPNQNTADNKYVTDSKGLSVIDNLTYNHAYKLVEVKAPEGYLLSSVPMYFYIKSSDTANYPITIPTDFDSELYGFSYEAGQNVFFGNSSKTTSITVNKEWRNPDGTQPSSIHVVIGRRLGSETDDAAESFHSVNIEHRMNWGNILEYKTYPSVKDGSTITFWAKLYNGATDNEVTINGSVVESNEYVTIDGETYEKYTITVNSDKDIVVKDCSREYYYDLSCELTTPSTSSVSGLESDEQNDSYSETTLTAANNWTQTITGLDKYKVVTDESTGKETRYVWNYYVKEQENIYYEASYSDNNKAGINSGTITITNTRREDVNPYVLPSTGGIGDLPIKQSGFMFMLLALIGSIFFNLFKRKKNNFILTGECYMKRLKKLLTGILAGAMALTMALSSGNATKVDAADHTITVQNASVGQTYTLYKLFDYEPTPDSVEVGSYKVTDETLKAYLRDNAASYLTVDSNGYITWTNTDTNSDTDGTGTAIAAFAANIQSAISSGQLSLTSAGEATATETTVVFTVSDYGYYMVSSTLGALVSIDTTKENATVYEKNTAPTITKEVKEDSTGNYGEKNDAQIGQVVEYKTTVNAKKGGINYIVHDKMDAGLSFNSDSVKVTKDGSDLTAGTDYTVNVPGTGENTFDIEFKNTTAFTEDSTIVITYTATITNAAVVSTGLKNDTYLEYNNKAETEHDITYTYVYAFDLYKNDETKGLANAKFTMTNTTHGNSLAFVFEGTQDGKYVYRVANETEASNATAVSTKDASGNRITPTLTEGTAYTEIITPESGKVYVRGLDSDNYSLVETEAPVGYNLKEEPTNVVVIRADAFDGSYSVGDDNNVVSVVNKTGALLPSTGGIGTTIFYIIGGILIIAGIAYFIVRRKGDN